jgi:hypothetical protein
MKCLLAELIHPGTRFGGRELDKFGMATVLSRDRGFPDASPFLVPDPVWALNIGSIAALSEWRVFRPEPAGEASHDLWAGHRDNRCG